ncbi:amino acid permease [Amycolatopsis sp. NBRC 101858]|uniref:APC family permease n=1 Tax=Amycolatopsis sp. NBRC 101858 TaxID=3032200 RepID=UPI0024A431BB|nr:APC family permease [Amycolatopsis sp. NBRC 101858]GLY42569.1 amino acid permease [Amycolatopsis sp. NBRC 101858]
MSDTVETRPGLRRSLSVWQAVGLSVALMAPSMAANINPQQTAAAAGRAVPLAFLLSAVGVLLVAYGFVKLCRYYQHAGSVYAFVGATLGPRAGVVSGIGLLGTYTFYAVVTSSAAGTLGTAFLTQVGIWPDPPSWGPFVLTAVALIGAWLLSVVPARRGTSTLLAVEGATIAVILLVTVVILVRLLAGNAPSGARFTLDVFVPDTGVSGVFLGAVFGFLSFAGFEAAATLGEETHDPKRNIPRAILGTAIFGGIYFVVVTAVEMMAFGTDATAFHDSPSLLGDLGSRYAGAWVGDVISVGAAISAFGCCLACVVGGSRLLFALGRDAYGGRGIGRTSGRGTPVAAVGVVTGAAALIILVCALFFGATASDTFAWSGSIGTLILLVIYLLTTAGAILLLFVKRRMRVPGWHLVFPVGALAVLGYTVYVNVVPYPTEGPARWFPVVAGGVLVLAVILVLSAPGFARRVGERLGTVDGGA